MNVVDKFGIMSRRHILSLCRCSLIAFSLLCAIAVNMGCKPDFDDAESQLVVEGWIENGRFPKVKLTYTVPVSDDYQDLSNLEQYVEKWAKVTVNDGERTVSLMGHIEDDELPSYVYTTSEMRGEIGKTYHLSVDCPNGIHAEALTVIPEPIPIDRFEVETVGATSESYQLYGYVNPSGALTNDCYKLFTKVRGEPYGFRSAYMGLVNDVQLGTVRRVAINKGSSNIEEDFQPYFSSGDSVAVKFAHLSDDSYVFWRDFEDMLGLSRNPLFPITENLHSNVRGGLGYWFGYGIYTYVVTFGDDGFTLLNH